MNLSTVYSIEDLQKLAHEPSALAKRYSLTEATIKSLKEKGKYSFLTNRTNE